MLNFKTKLQPIMEASSQISYRFTLVLTGVRLHLRCDCENDNYDANVNWI